MDLVINLIGAVAKILWPILGFTILLTFRKELAEILRRIKKGKVLGQEIELSGSLEELRLSAETTKVVAESLPTSDPEPTTAIMEKTEQDEIKHILDEATKSPRVALITLSGYIDIAARRALASTGNLINHRASSTETMEKLSNSVGGLPENILNSTKLFMTIRNKLVHMKEASEDDIISALDSGITILRTLKALPIQKNIVRHSKVPLFKDPECQIPVGGLGVIIELVGPGGIKKNQTIFPTLREWFEVGQVVSWEWDLSNIWQETWYIEPETGLKKLGWHSSGEFIGRSLDSI
ncbi:hypothetical protein HX891_16050 [Pseudomonas reactans]|uniref:hypothetical protein n=1 Tax=Pseudomonas reactans TaxID=117680 RepID=UPI0015B85337|nr:hypothetical protein [Pseudomonas reactans]NWD81896.1 hypothetical protein [Pseudomonas reactans]